MRYPRSGGDDPMVAALARWKAAKKTYGFVFEATLALYEGQPWEDATHRAAEASGEEWPVVRQWLESNRVLVEAMLEAMQTCIRRPEDVARCWQEALKRRGIAVPEEPS